MSPAPATPSPNDRRPMPSMGARLVVAVDADGVGSRVSVRYLLEGDRPTDPDALMTDVVGQLEAWTGSHALIRRRTGEVVQVPISAIVAAKVVPPAPHR